MRKYICLIIILIGFLLISCDLSTDPQNNVKIHKAIGMVSENDIQVGSADLYCFGDYGDKRVPSSAGFKNGDNVYFEAEVVLSNKNSQGGTTYWCKLLLIRKYNQ